MFRFTIRDVLLGMAVVGLGVGWWVDRQRLVAVNGRLGTTMGEIYQRALPGKPLAVVVQEQQLEQVPSWHMPNLPPGADGEVIYFLNHGDLELRYAGEPATINQAQFRPSDQTADERYRAATAGWSSWVEAHSE